MHTETKTYRPNNVVRKVIATLISSSGELIEIFDHEYSGRVINREKKATITDVVHPGIILGVDKFERIWVAHNHYLNKRPMFDELSNFSDIKEPVWDNRKVLYAKDVVIQRVLDEVRKAKPYNALNYNCQTFINLIVRNEHSSEAVDKVSDGVILGGLFLAIVGLATKSKSLTTFGLVTAGIGGGAKVYSKLR